MGGSRPAVRGRPPTNERESAQYTMRYRSTMPTGDRLRMPTRALARFVGLTFTFALTASVAQAQPRTVIAVDPADKAAAFGAADLSDAIARWRVPVTVVAPAQLAREAAPNVVVVTTETAKLPGQPGVRGLTEQGYAIRRVTAGGTTRWWAIGHDPAGAMYAALELAEAARSDGHLDRVVDRDVNPFIVRRGIKFNIPLDARTPSYSDDSTSGQANIPEMWDMGFWTRFLDEMARHRYNVLSLWSLSPFPSLVKVPEYPKVALADVKRKTGAMFDATNQGRNMYDPSWPLETVRTMTIDEKIAFWRGVMQYARDRGIDVSVFTWNIFVYGTEGSGYGLTVDPRNATTKDYVRTSTRALFNTYPLLTAIGVTSGENMGDLDDAGKEQWMWETYGLGVKDAIADAADPASPFHRPGRRITLIHRAHQADLKAIVETFKALPGSDRSGADSTLAFSFKYSQAHMHSSTAPRFMFQNGWYDSMPEGKQTWLTVRNDDFYYLRWGDPDFVRAYWTQLPQPRKIAGFMLGPDGYTWGRDFVSARATTPRRLVIEKQWYWFMLWGRLAYEPAMPNERFEAALEARFPKAGASVAAGLAATSKIVPLLNRFYWGYFDFQWYPGGIVEPGRLRRYARAHRPEIPADARGRGRRDAADHVDQGVRRRRSARGKAHAARRRRTDGPLRGGWGPADREGRRLGQSPSSRRPSETSARWPPSAVTTPPRSAAPSSSRATRRRRTRRRTPGHGRRSRHRPSTGASTRACGAPRTSATCSRDSARRWST